MLTLRFPAGQEPFTIVLLRSTMDRRTSRPTINVATLSLPSRCTTRLFSVSFSLDSHRFPLLNYLFSQISSKLSSSNLTIL